MKANQNPALDLDFLIKNFLKILSSLVVLLEPWLRVGWSWTLTKWTPVSMPSGCPRHGHGRSMDTKFLGKCGVDMVIKKSVKCLVDMRTLGTEIYRLFSVLVSFLSEFSGKGFVESLA